MKIKINRTEGITTLIPDKIYPSGYELEISFCEGYVCFTIEEGGIGHNVQISYEEFKKLKEIEFSEEKNS